MSARRIKNVSYLQIKVVKEDVAKENVNINKQFVRKLVDASIFNVIHQDMENWTSAFSKDKSNKKFFAKVEKRDLPIVRKMVRRLYCKKVWDINGTRKFVINNLSCLRYLALSKEISEEQVRRYLHEYTEEAIAWLKEGAFSDPIIMEFVSKLRMDICVGNLPLEARKARKAELDALLESLKLNINFAGKRRAELDLNKLREIYNFLMEWSKKIVWKSNGDEEFIRKGLKRNFSNLNCDELRQLARILFKGKHSEAALRLIGLHCGLTWRTVQSKLPKSTSRP